MGQTCGAADPSQWMRVFGVDIDSRDTSGAGVPQRLEEVPPASISRAGTAAGKALWRGAAEASLVNERSLEVVPGLEAQIVEGEGFDFYTVCSLFHLGRRLLRDLLCTEHDAGRRLGHLPPWVISHTALSSISPDPAERGAGVLRRSAAHRPKSEKEIKIIGDGA